MNLDARPRGCDTPRRRAAHRRPAAERPCALRPGSVLPYRSSRTGLAAARSYENASRQGSTPQARRTCRRRSAPRCRAGNISYRNPEAVRSVLARYRSWRRLCSSRSCARGTPLKMRALRARRRHRSHPPRTRCARHSSAWQGCPHARTRSSCDRLRGRAPTPGCRRSPETSRSSWFDPTTSRRCAGRRDRSVPSSHPDGAATQRTQGVR